ncbi:MAG: hypothetical protein ACXWJK_04895, partial [Burkholderiaceae bacterium]
MTINVNSNSNSNNNVSGATATNSGNVGSASNGHVSSQLSSEGKPRPIGMRKVGRLFDFSKMSQGKTKVNDASYAAAFGKNITVFSSQTMEPKREPAAASMQTVLKFFGNGDPATKVELHTKQPSPHVVRLMPQEMPELVTCDKL